MEMNHVFFITGMGTVIRRARGKAPACRFLMFMMFMLLLLGLLLYLVVPVAAASLDIETEAGFSHQGKPGHPVPLWVTLDNQGPHIQGKVGVTYWLRDQEAVQYLFPLDLPPGGQGEILCYLPGETLGRYQLEVLDREGKVIQETRVRNFSFLEPGYYLGIFSQGKDDLHYLGLLQRPDGEGRAKAINLKPGRFPDRAQALFHLDAIFVGDYDLSTLSPGQVQALGAWVREGGSLVLSGGTAYRGNYSALPRDLRPVEVLGSREVQEITPLEGLAGVPLESYRPFSLDTAKVLPGGEALVSRGDDPVIVYFPAGKGRVIYTAFDLTREPAASWQGNKEMWENLLLSPEVRYAFPEYRLPWILGNMVSLGFPSLGWLLLLLVTYAVALGPVNYLVLKKIDRREWAWLTVPLLVLLFSVGIFCYNYYYKGGAVTLNTISIIDLRGEGAEARHFAGLFAPHRGDFSLVVQGDPGINYLGQHHPVGMEPYTGARVFYLGDTGDTVVEFPNLGMWSMRCISFQEEVPGFGTLQGELQVRGDSIVGHVINQTILPLEDLMLIYPFTRDFQHIEKLAPGEKVEIELPLETAVPGSRDPYIQAFMWELYPRDPRGSPSPEEETWWETRQRILEVAWGGYQRVSILDNWEAPQLLGWARVTPLGVKALGEKTRQSSITLVKAQLPLDFQDGNRVYIPPGALQGQLVDTRAEFIDPYQERSYFALGEQLYRLDLPEEKYASIEELDLYLSTYYSPYFQVYLYNYREEEYELIQLKEGRAALGSGEDYLSPGRYLQVKVVNPSREPGLMGGVTISLKATLEEGMDQ